MPSDTKLHISTDSKGCYLKLLIGSVSPPLELFVKEAALSFDESSGRLSLDCKSTTRLSGSSQYEQLKEIFFRLENGLTRSRSLTTIHYVYLGG